MDVHEELTLSGCFSADVAAAAGASNEVVSDCFAGSLTLKSVFRGDCFLDKFVFLIC